MSAAPGIGGFDQRQVRPDDPVVCGACGATVGTQGGLRTEEAQASARAGHDPECRQRLAHQRRHRASDGPCYECKGETA